MTLLTVPELAAMLGVSQTWIYDHARGDRRPQLPVIRLGRLIRFRQTDVEEWLKKMGVAA